MLVYLKEPMGYTELDGYRVYGCKYAYGSFGSTDLPMAIYKKYKDRLEHAQYTTEWLEKKFNRPFPKLAFTIDSLYKMDFLVLVEIAKLVGIDYRVRAKKNPTVIERNALRRSVISFLNK